MGSTKQFREITMDTSTEVQAPPLGNRTQNRDVLEIVDNIENLMEESKVLDEKMERLSKKKKENFGKISNLIEKMRRAGDMLDDRGNSHQDLLKDLENEAGRDENWKDQFEKVQKYRAIHQRYKNSKEIRLEAIRQQMRRIESGVQGAFGTSFGSVRNKKILKEKFVTHQAAASTSGAGPNSSSSISLGKRKLNESVVDCGLIRKKISLKEKEAIVPKVLKIEEPSPPNPHECNFCGKSFTSAAPLASHLVKHYTQFEEKLDCPFPTCNFAATQENLIKHMRSKHTKEQLFSCYHCNIKFYTMDAKVAHEKKHGQPEVWAQCDQPACLMFYQVARGNCRCAKK